MKKRPPDVARHPVQQNTDRAFWAVSSVGGALQVDVVVVLTVTLIIMSVVTGQVPVTRELRNTPGKTHATQGGTRIHHS